MSDWQRETAERILRERQHRHGEDLPSFESQVEAMVKAMQAQEADSEEIVESLNLDAEMHANRQREAERQRDEALALLRKHMFRWNDEDACQECVECGEWVCEVYGVRDEQHKPDCALAAVLPTEDA